MSCKYEYVSISKEDVALETKDTVKYEYSVEGMNSMFLEPACNGKSNPAEPNVL